MYVGSFCVLSALQSQVPITKKTKLTHACENKPKMHKASRQVLLAVTTTSKILANDAREDEDDDDSNEENKDRR